MCDGYNATSGTTGANGRCGGPSVALGGRYYLHYPLSYHLYCPDRPDHVLRRYEHSLAAGVSPPRARRAPSRTGIAAVPG
jgi:hypothetical protein